ncbi:MAG: helix-turn-helix domain-containing protein [PVC group bacterium]
MADIAKALKEEIVRLSRKEVKKSVLPLRGRLLALVRTVARQEKTITGLQKVIARQKKLLAEAAPVPEAVPEEDVRKARISPRLVRAQRKRLKLKQGEFARLLGVSVATIRSWEQGRSQPRGDNLAIFIAVRRMKLAEARERLGITPAYRKRGRPKKKGRRKKGS